jgi:hypothetical protein
MVPRRAAIEIRLPREWVKIFAVKCRSNRQGIRKIMIEADRNDSPPASAIRPERAPAAMLGNSALRKMD